MDQIRHLIEENEHLTVRVLAQLTEMNKSSIHTIFSGNLNIRRVYSVWVPFNLTANHKLLGVQCANDILNCFRELEDSVNSKYAVEDETFVLFEQPNNTTGFC